MQDRIHGSRKGGGDRDHLIAGPDGALAQFRRGQGSPIELSLIVPMYNEEDAIDRFFERIEPILNASGATYEIICINDGSQDHTLEKRLDRRSRVAEDMVQVLLR